MPDQTQLNPKASELPSDGTLVTAMRYESIEYDRPAYPVTGVLSTHPSPFGDYPQCFVDDTMVDPESVRPVESPDATETPPAVPTANVDVQSDPGIEDGLPAL